MEGRGGGIEGVGGMKEPAVTESLCGPEKPLFVLKDWGVTTEF